MIYILFNFLVKVKVNKKTKSSHSMILNMVKVLNKGAKGAFLKKVRQKIFKRNCMMIVICNQLVR